MNKTLILLRGVPGCGKSFTANLLSENSKYPVLSADMYFEDEHGNYNWDSSKIKDAHAWCKATTESCMEQCHSRRGVWCNVLIPNTGLIRTFDATKIFVANTFTQEWEMADYFDLAKQYGYDVVTMIVENRHGGKNVHDVPDSTLEKMCNRFEVKL